MNNKYKNGDLFVLTKIKLNNYIDGIITCKIGDIHKLRNIDQNNLPWTTCLRNNQDFSNKAWINWDNLFPVNKIGKLGKLMYACNLEAASSKDSIK